MLKMFANGTRQDGKPVKIVVFGLSHKNLEMLRAGKPIKFNGATAGLADDVEFLIFAGESERSMQREFADLVGPDTVVKIDPRLKD